MANYSIDSMAEKVNVLIELAWKWGICLNVVADIANITPLTKTYIWRVLHDYKQFQFKKFPNRSILLNETWQFQINNMRSEDIVYILHFRRIQRMMDRIISINFDFTESLSNSFSGSFLLLCKMQSHAKFHFF